MARKLFAPIKIGDRYNDWEVIGTPKIINRHTYALCKCKCEKIKMCDTNHIRKGHSECCLSCAEKKNRYKIFCKRFDITDPKELIGRKLGKSIVIDIVRRNGRYDLKMKCTCGRFTFTDPNRILNEDSYLCNGCAHVKSNIESLANRKYYSECPRDVKKIWMNIFTRCYRENSISYHNYGGRGIKVHPSYFDLKTFYEDLGPRPSKNHSVDRIDPDGDYSPGNLRWATTAEQNANRRCSPKHRDKYILVKKTDLCGKCLENCLHKNINIPEDPS